MSETEEKKSFKKETKKRRVWVTQQFERELLNILLKDPIILRRVVGSIKEEWMSDTGREFILQNIIGTFRGTGNLITKDALIYELEKNMTIASDPRKVAAFTTEIDIVFASNGTLNCDFLIAKLEEADGADGLMAMLEESFAHLEKGDLANAISSAKAGSLHLASGKKAKPLIDIDRETDTWLAEVVKRKNNPDSLVGVPTGFQKIDDQTGGLFPAELVIVFGLSGKGKSTVLKAMCNHMREVGKNILHVCNEENQFQVNTKYQTVMSGIEYHKFKWGKINDEELDRWKHLNEARKKKVGSLHVLEIPPGGNATLIQKAFYQLAEEGTKIDLVCVDYMDLMAPTQRAYSENDEQAKVTSDLLQLAKDCDIPVLTATQASTSTQKQETKDKPFLTAQDVYGTKRKAHSANMLIGIVNQTASTAEVATRDPSVKQPHVVVFVVPKQRDGSSFWFKMLLYPEIGKFEECADDLGGSVVKAAEKQALALATEDPEAPVALTKLPSLAVAEAEAQAKRTKELLKEEWKGPMMSPAQRSASRILSMGGLKH